MLNQASGIRNIKITQNYEMHRGNSIKSVINEKSVDAEALYFLYAQVYEKHIGRFFHDDLEMSLDIFFQRLIGLRSFLERAGDSPENKKRMLSAVKATIRAVSSLPTKWVKLEACTGRLLTDQGPVFFGARSSGQIQELLRGFCCQGEFTPQEVLEVLKGLR